MRIPLLTEKKRDGGRLTPAGIRHIVHEFTAGKLPGFPMCALAMPVLFNGPDEEETAVWTAATRAVGELPQGIDIHKV